MYKTCLLLALMLPCQVYAGGPGAAESECLNRIREESDFLVSRINHVNRQYENQIRNSGLGRFRSGDYSTGALLDNTIRKYHRKLVSKIRHYPFQYQTRLRGTDHGSGHVCFARQLHEQAVGTIHEFELSWQQALQKARTNAEFFRRMDGLH